MSRDGWVRILPFAVFMVFIGLEDIARTFGGANFLLYAYPVRAGLVGVLLLVLWPYYRELRVGDFFQWRSTLLSIAVGLAIFVLWIHMDWPVATLGAPRGFVPADYDAGALRFAMITVRLCGAIIVVPLMEELFWRSFLLRFLVNSDFMRVPLGTFSWFSFVATTVLFGLEHHLVLAGMVAGALFNVLLYRTRSLFQCILSHAVANCALGIYVLRCGQWHFW